MQNKLLNNNKPEILVLWHTKNLALDQKNIMGTKIIINALFFVCVINFLFCSTAICQVKEYQYIIRISGQLDFQKESFTAASFPFEFKEDKAITNNFGLDFLIEKKMGISINIHSGIGYYRNRFNFKRFYDHTLLNTGTDSVGIGTGTKNYTYHLIRLPFAVSYDISKKKNRNICIGIEAQTNFSFQQVYNGGVPFQGANNKYTSFQYFGNCFLIIVQIRKQLKQNSALEIAPYLRFLNIYKRKNPILFENTANYYTRTFDAVGLSIKYYFKL